ncbi:MAG: DMT family transporter [Coriobacteriales bacterium]
MKPSTRNLLITCALVGVAVVWGGTFLTVKNAVAGYPLYGFLAWRFAVATVAFVALFPSSVRRMDLRIVRIGVLAGAFLTAGYVFQTWGLQDTTASKAAFITGMFVVITPLLQSLVLKRPPRLATLGGVLLAVAGLWLLAGGSVGGWNIGDTRVLLCAVAYSAHMIVLGGPGRELDVRSFTLVQLLTVAVTTAVISALTERPPLPTESSLVIALVITGVLGSAVAFVVQTYAQRYLSPTKTALILITEPAFGGLFGWLAGEKMGMSALAGSALILGGMVVAELLGARAPVTEHVELKVAVEGPPVPMAEGDDDQYPEVDRT